MYLEFRISPPIWQTLGNQAQSTGLVPERDQLLHDSAYKRQRAAEAQSNEDTWQICDGFPPSHVQTAQVIELPKI